MAVIVSTPSTQLSASLGTFGGHAAARVSLYRIMGKHLTCWVHTVSRFAWRDEILPPAFRLCFKAHTLRAVFSRGRRRIAPDWSKLEPSGFLWLQLRQSQFGFTRVKSSPRRHRSLRTCWGQNRMGSHPRGQHQQVRTQQVQY